ncbi:hypothetical protein PLICRDRAFT_460186 [Plicaturopsis crispa FD-325 SS-3]|nr:hypothetical protein PLICRDRAFT_460186 [Plicaturopsis crispa FD-325 SS-3]
MPDESAKHLINIYTLLIYFTLAGVVNGFDRQVPYWICPFYQWHSLFRASPCQISISDLIYGTSWRPQRGHWELFVFCSLLPKPCSFRSSSTLATPTPALFPAVQCSSSACLPSLCRRPTVVVHPDIPPPTEGTTPISSVFVFSVVPSFYLVLKAAVKGQQLDRG